MRVLYYALGGGHGHVLRGLAVLSRLRYGTLIGPARLAGWAETLGVAYRRAPEPYDARWIATLPTPDLLLVDVFPRGIVAELPSGLGHGPAWLIARLVRPAYYLHPPVRAAIGSWYERVVWTETPPLTLRGLHGREDEISPVLLPVSPVSRDAARHALGVPSGRRLLLGIGGGDIERQHRLCRLLDKVAARLNVAMRFVSAELPSGGPVRHLFPAAPLLPAADVVVAGGGYHAVHEARAAGVPAVFITERRRYDDQWARVAGEIVATDPLDLETKVSGLLAAGGVAPRGSGDGASALACLIERRMQNGVLAQKEVAPLA